MSIEFCGQIGPCGFPCGLLKGHTPMKDQKRNWHIAKHPKGGNCSW